MSQEYPKMLYTGDKKQYSGRIVQDADEEQQYRDLNFTDYANLPEFEPKNVEVALGEVPQGFVTTEQFDAVGEQLATAQGELSAFKNDISAMQERIVELQGKNESDDSNNELTDYSDFTIPQLQEVLDAKGIKYLARDNKETLINLLG